jgi:cytochrome c556
MRFAIRIVGIAMAIASGVLLAASADEVAKNRINFMEDEIGAEWKVLAAFTKGQGSLADVEKSAMNLSNLAKKIPSHFPKDTGRGKVPDHLTRSLPEIWSDPQGFQKATQNFAEQSAKLAALAKAGDKDAVVDMIGTKGGYNAAKIGCGECHKQFRGERVKK